MVPASCVAWQPRLGAYSEAGAVRFRVWAPRRHTVELVLRPGQPSSRRHRLTPAAEGMFTGVIEDASAGDLYAYFLDGQGPFPDPASRFQPQGVHGPSAVVDARVFPWTDQEWRGVPLAEAVLYELHVGTFTPSGTFAGVTARLPDLAHLGVTAIELMPISDFPGSRNWGYDVACHFAPSRAYGTPDDLRRLVDTAHGLGLAVVLDVVCNHFGPDGAYAALFSPFYLSTRHRSPWGAAVNLDGDGAAHVREFFIENALHWLHEYHVDGFRLDATHSLVDDSSRHFAGELAACVRASAPHRAVLVFAEDDRNLAAIVRPPEDGGWGLDAVWADDFHHHVHRMAAGDRHGYYEDFSGAVDDIAKTIRQGWFYRGQFSRHRGAPRGTDPSGVPLERMVVCLQNHDQIGNHPFGRRLNQQIDAALFRALSALLLFVPETPLLFMGQEWAATTPFLFFTDHHADLGRLVTEGRRAEFARLSMHPITRANIPDPQAVSTFEACRLSWEERERPRHAGMLELYRSLLGLRRTHAALRRNERFEAAPVDDASLVLLRGTAAGETLLLVVCAGSSRRVDLNPWRAARPAGMWEVLLTTEESRFREPDGLDAASDPAVDLGGSFSVTFHRPSAVILRTR